MSGTRRHATRFLTGPATYLLLTVGEILMILPFVWMMLPSFMTSAEVIARPLTWIPSTLQVDSYRNLSDAIPLSRSYLNNAIVPSLTTLGILLSSSLAGYGF